MLDLSDIPNDCCKAYFKVVKPFYEEVEGERVCICGQRYKVNYQLKSAITLGIHPNYLH